MKVRLGLAAICAAVVLIAVVLLAPASSNASGGAVITKDSGCWIFDPNGRLTLADADHVVITSNNTGTVWCKATVRRPVSGQAVKFNIGSSAMKGLACQTPMGFTNDWQETISATGQATLRCTVHSNAANRATRLRR